MLEIRRALTVTFVVFLLCVSTGSVRAYTGSDEFFSIEEPSGWTINESTSGTIVVTFVEPTSANESIALIEIDVETVTGNTSLSELATNMREQYPTVFDSYDFISGYSRVVNGVDAYEMVSAITTQGYNLMLRQVMMVRNTRIYIVSYVATMERYQQFLPDFEDSIETFTIIDPIPWYFGYVFIGAIVAVVAVIAVGLHIYKKRTNTPIASY